AIDRYRLPRPGNPCQSGSAPVAVAEGDLQVLRLIWVVGAVLRPVLRPALDVSGHDRVGDDRLPVRQVVDRHQVEVRELLSPLDALGDAPAGVVDDVRVLPERWVVDLADELRVLVLVELARGIGEQDELLGHADLLYSITSPWIITASATYSDHSCRSCWNSGSAPSARYCSRSVISITSR